MIGVNQMRGKDFLDVLEEELEENGENVSVETDLNKTTVTYVNGEDCLLVGAKQYFYNEMIELEKCQDCVLHRDGKCVYELQVMRIVDNKSRIEDSVHGGMPSSSYSWFFDCPYCTNGASVMITSGLSSLPVNDPYSDFVTDVSCKSCRSTFLPLGRLNSDRKKVLFACVPEEGE